MVIMIRKGYLFVVFFSLLNSVLYSFYYRIFIRQDLGKEATHKLILQISISFILLLIPGLLLVRWYYKMKNRS